MDFLNSFFQNIKDKLTSPFFGTLTVILIIHHWEFWYTLFNFDKDCTRTEKVATLRLIANAEFGGWSLVHDIITAVIIMLIGYGIVMATRTLSLTIDFRFMPWITGKVINKKVVERSVHEDVVKERDEYSEKYEDQRKLVRSFSKDYDAQSEQIQSKNDSINFQQDQIASLQNSNAELENNLQTERSTTRTLRDSNEQIKTELDITESILASEKNALEISNDQIESLLKMLLSPNVLASIPDMPIPISILDKVKDLKDAGEWANFQKYISFEENGGSMNSSILTRMQALGIASMDRRERMTPLGKYLAAYEPFLS
ncbi:coiled-coil domain-containing protein [Pedobacter nototheniae]|uniref:hypothetical protein n=1 Tax=Pedobacter nototheniae TaxID=2488994 RepID=UPI00103EB30D|nr:hypothetical protein [Pedobacter nototheniae]